VRIESIIFGIAGVFFGLLAGWILRDTRETASLPGPVPVPAASQSGAPSQPQAPPALDESRAAALKVTAERNPSDVVTRVQLGDLYFDADRYDEAMRWYEAALKIDPKNVNASTDLGIAYYYSNQPDRALAQFDRSLAIDPKHSKTLLNMGIVRAFGKQDFQGAAKAWQRVLEVAAPGSPEAAKAKQGLDGLRAAHPDQLGGAPAAKSPGPPQE
jgi:cytochrome c-type biogenesis protein CcmH/NrfG